MNVMRNGYPAMWASFMETFFAFYFYDEFKDFSWFFIKDMEYWKGALTTFNAALAALIGSSVSFVHDCYLRNLVEKKHDKVSKELFQGNYRRAHGYMQ